MKTIAPLPPLSSLRAFEAVARCGSVKGASESLHLTPSAITHQIRSLETHFGVQLVKRSGRNIILAAAGEIYAAAVVNAFGELSRAGDRLLAGRRDRVVRVCVTPTFATLAALPRLKMFRDRNADLDLHLEARNAAVDLESERADAAVQLGEPPFPGLVAHRLLHSRGVPCAAPAVFEDFGPIERPADLAGIPLIEFGTARGSWRQWFQAHAPEHQDVEPQLLSDSLLTGLQMAQSGVGLLIAPFPLVASVTASGALKALTDWPIESSPPERDFYLTYRRVDAGSEKIKAVQKWLKSVVRELDAEAVKFGI